MSEFWLCLLILLRWHRFAPGPVRAVIVEKAKPKPAPGPKGEPKRRGRKRKSEVEGESGDARGAEEIFDGRSNVARIPPHLHQDQMNPFLKWKSQQSPSLQEPPLLDGAGQRLNRASVTLINGARCTIQWFHPAFGRIILKGSIGSNAPNVPRLMMLSPVS